MVRHMGFFVIALKSRAVQIAGIRIAPDGAWMAQVARNLLDPVDGFLRNASHLIHDRDPLFTRAWVEFVEHYLTERYHQGIGSQLIQTRRTPSNDNARVRPIRCRSRLGGVLEFYHREAE